MRFADPKIDLVNSQPTNEHPVLDRAQSEYFGDLDEYGRFSENRSQTNEKFKEVEFDTAVRMTHIAYVTAVGSIRTDTGRWETLVGEYLRGEIDDTELVGRTFDGETKSEKVAYVLEDTGILRSATGLLRINDVEGAILMMAGRVTDDTDETYIRTTKGMFIAWLLGFDVWCIDHRIHGELTSDGFLMNILRPKTTTRPGIQKKYNRVDEKGHKPMEVDWWHDTLKWSPAEYYHHSDAVMEFIADRTDIPKDRVSQVLFNMAGDERRTHETLTGLLSG